MKVISREQFKNNVVTTAKEMGCTNGEIGTMQKIAENAKEIRLSDKKDKALVLMGCNVYKTNYFPILNEIKLQRCLIDISEKEYRHHLHIKELAADDKRIYATK